MQINNMISKNLVFVLERQKVKAISIKINRQRNIYCKYISLVNDSDGKRLSEV